MRQPDSPASGARRPRAAANSPASARNEAPAHVQPRPWRIIARERADETLAVGLPRPWFGDFYHLTLRIPLAAFLGAAVGLYLAANAVFALLYLAQPGSIANARPGSFADAFFFSVQTIATLGYGVMAPATFYANVVVTIETATGLLLLALTTGLTFARFSRPTARVLFSRVAVVGPYNGAPTLSLRLANQRRNQILQAEVDVALLRDERTAEGDVIRRFYDLSLVRRRTPVFAMTFTVMHMLEDDSPLCGCSPGSLKDENAELVVTVTGLDETMAQPVQARTSYLPDEILWNRRFVDIIGWTEDGRRVVDYRRFHDTVPLADEA